MKVTSDYNLEKLHVELAKEWHPTKNDKLTPFKVTPGRHKKVWTLMRRKNLGKRFNGVRI